MLDCSGFLINSHDPLRGHVLKHTRQNSLTSLRYSVAEQGNEKQKVRCALCALFCFCHQRSVCYAGASTQLKSKKAKPDLRCCALRRKKLSTNNEAKSSTNFELTTLENYSDKNLLAELRRVAAEFNGKRLTRKRFNEISRAHSSTLEYRFGSWKNALDLAGISETIAPRFNPLTREAVLASLRAYAAEFSETSVTQEEIAHRLKVGRGRITRKFGKWQDLLTEVGLSSVPLGRRYTDEECYENIVALWTHYGRQPNFAELKRPPSTVGSKTYVLRWGGWRAALSAFIKYVNQEPQADQKVISEKNSTETSAPQTPPVVTPRSISLSLRYKVLSRDRFRCVRCGRSPAKDLSVELHVDHQHPWSKGGPNTEENLRTYCFDCNLGKGAKIEVNE